MEGDVKVETVDIKTEEILCDDEDSIASETVSTKQQIEMDEDRSLEFTPVQEFKEGCTSTSLRKDVEKKVVRSQESKYLSKRKYEEENQNVVAPKYFVWGKTEPSMEKIIFKSKRKDHLSAFFTAMEATARQMPQDVQIDIKAEIFSIVCLYEKKNLQRRTTRF